MRKQMATPRVEIREVVRVDTVEVVKEVAPQKTVRGMSAHVLFGLNKTAVAKDQMPGIEAIANYLKKYPEAKASVSGYSDKATGTAAINERLANERAQSVVKVLKEKYGIDESRLQVAAWGDAEQPFSNNDWNRVVIMIAE
ncbi:MAG: OmpA family protein [Bacteroides sp.]